jgi:hydroxymethylpyrimidine/phosphomethylpyrimidine kinase
MNLDRPYCLSLAGFDPTAGAGVLADIKSFEMNGVYGMGIITANTLQTDSSFIKVDWIHLETLKIQLETLMKEYDFRVVKIGLIENFEVLSLLILSMKSLNPTLKIVWDPILKSSSGFDFHSNEEVGLLFLEEHCNLITPNWEEFEKLWGSNINCLTDRNPKAAILIKGGHRKEKIGCDLLFENGRFAEINGCSFNGKSKHGTGCVLSSVISANIAKGSTLLDSCIEGKKYIEHFILSTDSNLGFHYDNK